MNANFLMLFDNINARALKYHDPQEVEMFAINDPRIYEANSNAFKWLLIPTLLLYHGKLCRKWKYTSFSVCKSWRKDR